MLVLVAGCAAGPATTPSQLSDQGSVSANAPPGEDAEHPASAAPAHEPAHAGRPTHAAKAKPAGMDFPATTAALQREIDRLADELGQGPIGDRATELASLRLAASARDLVLSESPGGAREALDRAVSLYGRNGYAYLWLACVDHLEHRSDRAGRWLAKAGRDLPADRKIRGELHGLARRVDPAAAGRSAH
jgi:hypothetical protein